MSRRPDHELNGIPVFYDSTLQGGYARLFPAVSYLVQFQSLDPETQRAWRIASGLDRACWIAQSEEALVAALRAVNEGRRG